MSSNIIRTLIWVAIKAAVVSAVLFAFFCTIHLESGVGASLGIFVGLIISGAFTQVALPLLLHRRDAKAV